MWHTLRFFSESKEFGLLESLPWAPGFGRIDRGQRDGWRKRDTSIERIC